MDAESSTDIFALTRLEGNVLTYTVESVQWNQDNGAYETQDSNQSI